MTNKAYDIVLMGASSFVGKITAYRIAEFVEKNSPDTRWAIAGRSVAKLEGVIISVAAKLGKAFEIPIIEANSMDEAALKVLCSQTRVVISTVGPYDQYGELLLKCCAQSGTHYCDLTGEPNFIVDMLIKYEQDAQQTGACIVNCCGFDSIPSDLGAFYLQSEAIKKFGSPVKQINMRVKRMVGTASGGTIISMLNIMKKVKANPALRKLLINPYALAPTLNKVKQHFINKAKFDPVTKQWMAPFVMASINTKVVMRSAQLLKEQYPESFQYDEAMLMGAGAKGKRRAKLMTLGLGALMLGTMIPPIGWFLKRFVLPKVGEGPTEKQQQDGYYNIIHFAESDDGQTLSVEFTGDQDPGYGSTSKILTQSAFAIAYDLPADQQGGFWTPASIIAQPLIERLPKYAGIEIKVQ